MQVTVRCRSASSCASSNLSDLPVRGVSDGFRFGDGQMDGRRCGRESTRWCIVSALPTDKTTVEGNTIESVAVHGSRRLHGGFIAGVRECSAASAND
jgi:hypothetical protein